MANAPGVYVSEDASLSLAVTSGETAIPVFACSAADLTKLGFVKSGTTTAVDCAEVPSWLMVTKNIVAMAKNAFDANMPKVPATTEEAKKAASAAANAAALAARTSAESTALCRALYAYFVNGGGRAYLCQTATLTRIVPGLDDATLIVAAGETLPDLDALSGIFVLLDAPKNTLPAAVNAPGHASKHTATYYPWLSLPKGVLGATDSKTYDVAPSAVAAGVYCRVDSERGVWKAPANERVLGGLSLQYPVSDVQQKALNADAGAINVIRKFGNGAQLIWGARTGVDSSTDLRWRFVPVRRLFDVVEKDIKRTLSTVVFEPNSSVTWGKVRAAIDHYLHQIWRDGGLQGDKPTDAYSIQIGLGVTMTQEEVDDGIMKAVIGIAAVRPAEFIHLTFSQTLAATASA